MSQPLTKGTYHLKMALQYFEVFKLECKQDAKQMAGQWVRNLDMVLKSVYRALFIAAQFIGREIRCLNHYTAQGQPLAAHVHWLNKQGYMPDRADIWLPHDGVQGDKVYDTSYASALRQLGYDVTVVPNQGAGAASLRVESARRLFPSIWFNEATCGALLDALGWYHEKKDDARGIGLGPSHDWSSHDADCFGLMCIVYEAPERERAQDETNYYGEEQRWMA